MTYTYTVSHVNGKHAVTAERHYLASQDRWAVGEGVVESSDPIPDWVEEAAFLLNNVADPDASCIVGSEWEVNTDLGHRTGQYGVYRIDWLPTRVAVEGARVWELQEYGSSPGTPRNDRTYYWSRLSCVVWVSDMLLQEWCEKIDKHPLGSLIMSDRKSTLLREVVVDPSVSLPTDWSGVEWGHKQCENMHQKNSRIKIPPGVYEVHNVKWGKWEGRICSLRPDLWHYTLAWVKPDSWEHEESTVRASRGDESINLTVERDTRLAQLYGRLRHELQTAKWGVFGEFGEMIP